MCWHERVGRVRRKEKGITIYMWNLMLYPLWAWQEELVFSCQCHFAIVQSVSQSIIFVHYKASSLLFAEWTSMRMLLCSRYLSYQTESIAGETITTQVMIEVELVRRSCFNSTTKRYEGYSVFASQHRLLRFEYHCKYNQNVLDTIDCKYLPTEVSRWVTVHIHSWHLIVSPILHTSKAHLINQSVSQSVIH